MMTRKPLQTWILPLVIGGLAGAALVGPAAAEVLYVASPNRVVVLDSESGKQLGEIPLGHTVFDIVFTADGKRGYLACDDGVVEVDAQKHVVLGRLMKGPSFELELSADSSDHARTIASEVADKLLANPVIESYRIEVG